MADLAANTVLATIALVVTGIGVAQWLIGLVVGKRYGDRLKKIEEQWLQEDSAAEQSPTADIRLFVLVPCLDEELVIGDTVRALENADSRLRVVVIDDGSDDDTALVALAASTHNRTDVLQRRLPEARQGKGKALNFGLAHVVRTVVEEGLHPDRVVVAVMDADGQLSDGVIPTVLRHFHDPSIGGLQLQVRIRNTGSLITDYQDYEFWGVSAPAQVARAKYGSTSLGGNGQFTRLSALLMLGPTPWSDALTEDLDLAISVMAKGWKCVSTPSGWVSQQAVTSPRRLIRQRTRWMQGHVACARRVGELWRSERLPNSACLEGSAYLLSPVLLTLPWSILFHLGVYFELRLLTGPVPPLIAHSSAWTRAVLAVVWYAGSFLPAFVGAYRYVRRSDGAVSWRRGLTLAHLFVAFNYVSFAAVWIAVIRLVTGRNNWAKTTREHEPERAAAQAELGAPAPDAPAPADPSLVTIDVEALSALTPATSSEVGSVTTWSIGDVHAERLAESTRSIAAPFEAVPARSSATKE